MRLKNFVIGFVALAICLMFSTTLIAAGKFDYSKVKDLQGMELIEYFNTLGLKGQDALDFWKNIPVSKANKQVYDRFQKEDFQFYLSNVYIVHP